MSTAFSMLAFAAITMICVSYAWGMRGDLIGGEEGAVLPGALLGFCISFFIGNGTFDVSCLYFVALGMTGMFIGGTEPYAQAFEYTYWGCKGRKKPLNMGKGIAALAVKGAPWFGICAAVLGIGTSVAGGKPYSAISLIVLIALLPIVRALGTKLFNKPHDPEKGIFPKIYFSRTSQEEWGGLWFMLLTFIAFEMICKDKFALTITLFGSFGGALGWIFAQLLNCRTCAKKKGKYIFGKFQEQGRVDNWKIMEFTYGALGSLSIVLGYLFCRRITVRYARNIAFKGINSILSDDISHILFIVWFVLFIIDVLGNFIPKKFNVMVKIRETAHRPILCYIPMMLLLLGNLEVAKFMAVVVLFWLAPEELCFVQLRRRYNITVPVIISYAALAALIVFMFITPMHMIDLRLWFLLMCLLYFFSSAFMAIAAVYGREGVPKNIFRIIHSMGTFIPVKMHYLFCIVFASVFFFMN